MTDEINLTLNVINHIEQYYIPSFLCFFLLSSSLSVFVFFCTKLRYNSSSIYLGALTMNDIAALIMIFMMWFEWMDIINYEDWMHIFLFGLQWIFCFLSIWIIVAFTVQRYIVIKWPLVRRSFDTVNRAKTVVIGLMGLAILCSIPWLMFRSKVGKEFDTNEDITNLKYWLKSLNIADAIILLILPVTMIVMFNSLIVYTIHKQNRTRRNLILSSAASSENTRCSNIETSHNKVTKMLVIISSTYICLSVPIHVRSFLFPYDLNEDKHFSIILDHWISYNLYLTYHGINFVLYYATGENFRKEVNRIFTKCLDSKRSEDMEMENFED
nr:PREDICTED: probable G-protein coupled receptor 139 isoform X1 [Linepithema humile]